MADLSRNLSRVDGKLAHRGTILPPGPWHAEPDHVDFEHDGFACILHRGSSAAWCGYVAVPPSHPWHGQGAPDVSVHGGLTYAEKCAGAICHVAKPGESDDVWWLGFDCAHHLDLSAYDLIELGGATSRDEGGHGWIARYRDLAYVRTQTESLAAQCKAAIGGAA